MPTPIIYYIRHGETDWNAVGRLQGSRDIPMNEKGFGQANSAGRILHDLLKRDGRSPQDVAYVSSPMIRATATMQRVRLALELSADGYDIDDRLRELSYGDWEGLTLAEIEARDPTLFARRLEDKWETAPPSGESYAELAKRVAAWRAGVARDTVVSAHGGTLRALIALAGIARPAEAAELTIEQGVVYVFSNGGMEKYG
jgi:broad specificity phosphatase PhoE